MQKRDNLQQAIIDAIYDKKGEKITVVDLSRIETSAAPAFIICQGRSSSQVDAIADNVIEAVNSKLDIKPYNSDGFRNAQWIVIDYGSVMVHVFQPEVREFYNLEQLWSDGDLANLPDPD